MSKKRKNTDLSRHQRRQREKGLPWGYIIPALVILIIVLGLIYVEFRSPATATGFVRPPPGNGNFPFAMLTNEGLFLHVHPYLVIEINGKNVTIQSGIGILYPGQSGSYNGQPLYFGVSGSEFQPVHTHDDTGIIHIESPTNTNYTLGQFFQIWAATYAYVNFSGSERPIIFNSTDILGYKVTNSSTSLTLLVDGKPSTQYGNLILNTLAYCSSSNSASPPCSVSAAGDPVWNNGATAYPYGTGHTIVIKYTS
jgi:hypothetical protein